MSLYIGDSPDNPNGHLDLPQGPGNPYGYTPPPPTPVVGRAFGVPDYGGNPSFVRSLLVGLVLVLAFYVGWKLYKPTR